MEDKVFVLGLLGLFGMLVVVLIIYLTNKERTVQPISEEQIKRISSILK